MPTPTSTTTATLVSQQNGGLYADNGAFQTDGQGNITAVATTLSGTLSSTGNLTVGTTLSLKQSTGTAPTLASSGTITTAGVSIARVTTGGVVTAAIMQAGTIAGQTVTVVNESANTITMAAAATSNVSNGVTNVVAANAGNTYVWESLASTPVWVCVGKGA